jgi:hypothetical protein
VLEQERPAIDLDELTAVGRGRWHFCQYRGPRRRAPLALLDAGVLRQDQIVEGRKRAAIVLTLGVDV